MSLLCRFPFINDLSNSGLSTVNFTPFHTYIFEDGGKFGTSLKLHGNSEEFAVPGLTGLKNISVCYWVKLNAKPTTWAKSIALYDTSTSDIYIDSGETYGVFRVEFDGEILDWISPNYSIEDYDGSSINNNYISATPTMELGTWYHICVVIDAENNIRNSYCNGELIHVGSQSDHWEIENDTVVLYGGGTIDQNINDLRIYDHTLSLKEIKEISKGLLGRYTFDDIDISSTRQKVSDASGNRLELYYPANTSGSTEFTSECRHGLYSFKGTGSANNYLYNSSFPNLTENITYNCWIKISSDYTSDNSNEFIISQGRDYSIYGFNIIITYGCPRILINTNGSNGTVTSTKNCRDGKWHMLSATYDGEYCKLYIDGVKINQIEKSGLIDYTYSYGLCIGKMSYALYNIITYYPFTGLIDDVSIYATSLSDSDILKLYQNVAVIDKNGNLYASNIIESTDTENVKITKKANVYVSSVETGYTSMKKYNDGKITINSIQEK